MGYELKSLPIGGHWDARRKWEDLELTEKEVIFFWVVLVLFDGLLDVVLRFDFVLGYDAWWLMPVLELGCLLMLYKDSTQDSNLRHVYLWRVAPYFCKGEVDNVFCSEDSRMFEEMKGSYLPCFLLNSLLGVLVDNYFTLDTTGRLSKALSLQSGASGSKDVSFSSEGGYSGFIWCD